MKTENTARMQVRDGVVEVRRSNPKTMHTLMSGYITSALVEKNEEAFLEHLKQGPAPYWYFDLLTLTGFEKGAVPAGVRWWSAFKNQGGTHVIFVTEYGAARMAATAIGFSVGVKIIVCTSTNDAQNELQKITSSGR